MISFDKMCESHWTCTGEIAVVIPGDGTRPCGCRVVVVQRSPVTGHHRTDFRCMSASGTPPSGIINRTSTALHLALALRAHPACWPHAAFELSCLYHFNPALTTPTTPYIEPVTMATRTHNVEASLLDDRIDALDRNAVEASPAKEVFRAVSAILALVRVSPLALRPPVDSP